MKNKYHRLSELKHRLREKQERKVKRVIWQLTNEQKAYVENLGYVLNPFIYEIKTRTFSYADCSIVRDIHWAYKKGRKKIFRKLKRDEVRILDGLDIKYRVFRYEIILQ